MRSTDHVKKLIEEQYLDEAQAILSAADTPQWMPPAQQYYLQGLLHSKRSDWGKAQSCFLQASQLDPDGPATEALGVLTDIYDFYYKDLLNP